MEIMENKQKGEKVQRRTEEKRKIMPGGKK